MRRRIFSIGAGLLVAATLSSPAAATEVCAGTQEFQYVCVDPTGGTPITQCVYVGPPPCHPVSVPTPSITCGGDRPLLECQI
ncbi:MAG: hypothetical protein M3323_01735 [Actinomycetota bacterium]|nr:hypothetical protein [Actinomycetota bacterium]